jgi:hypothetical protein
LSIEFVEVDDANLQQGQFLARSTPWLLNRKLLTFGDKNARVRSSVAIRCDEIMEEVSEKDHQLPMALPL